MGKGKGKGYAHLRKELDLMLDGYDYDYDFVMEQLGTLMRRHGFRRGYLKDGTPVNRPPTGKQIDYAYDYISSITRRGQQKLDPYIEEERPTYYHQRATKDIIINGKKYKKGWFIPRKR
jgi:hypothetical protein